MRTERAGTRNASWFGGSIQTNPTAGTVLADTGPRNEASSQGAGGTEYEFVLVASCTISSTISVQHRDASNSSNIASFDVILPSGVMSFPFSARLEQGQRVRVVLASAITGQISVALIQVRTHD